MFATIATIIVIPTIWLFAHGPDSGSSRANTIVPAGTSPQPDAANSAVGSFDDPFGTNGPIFIDGPSTPPKPAVIQIVVPEANSKVFVEGGASYNRMIGVVDDSCSAPAVPLGATITVTNRDNGHKVVCVNNLPAPLAPKIVVVISTKLFQQLGELVDAPLPVRLTW